MKKAGPKPRKVFYWNPVLRVNVPSIPIKKSRETRRKNWVIDLKISQKFENRALYALGHKAENLGWVFRAKEDYRRFRVIRFKRLGDYVQFHCHCDKVQTEDYLRKCFEMALTKMLHKGAYKKHTLGDKED